nr:serine/threonine-protein phosphatase 7 long form homolog [Ipomoea batatas]
MPYHIDALPEFSRDGQHIWTVRVPLLYFFAVEWHYPDRVCRQFGGYQEIPASVEYDLQLHKYDGRQRSEQWDIFHYEFVQMWEQRNERVTTIARHAPLGPFVGGTNSMGDVTQLHLSQPVGELVPYEPGSSSQDSLHTPFNLFESGSLSQDPLHTPFNLFGPGSSSEVPQHDGRPIRSPSHVMQNAPFSHEIHQCISEDIRVEIGEDLLVELNGIMNSKKQDGKITQPRKSKRLAEISRQEMVRARRAANGGHEVGDTPSDPLVLLSEDEDIQPARAVERTVTYPPGEFIVFSTTESKSGPSNMTESESWPSSEASRDTSTRSKSESSTAFSTNKKK